MSSSLNESSRPVPLSSVMQEQHYNFFYGTVCHVCKRLPQSPETTNFCSGCRLVQYCNTSHQKEDWPNHREFCKAIQLIVKKAGTKHVYEEALKFTEEDGESWNKLRMSVLQLTKLVMKRPHTEIEGQMILFPAVCNVCYCYESKKMYPCDGCSVVMYCSQEHQLKDTKHRNICTLLALSFKIDLTLISQQDAYNLSCEQFNCEQYNFGFNNKLPLNMESFLKLDDQHNEKKIWLSNPLSYLLTLCFVIHQVIELRSTNLVIHIVGADSMEVLASHFMFVIFNLMPNLTHLNVIMIGPNLKNIVPPHTCEKYSLNVCNMLYHDYTGSDGYVTPDIIAVFNGGFCEVIGTEEDIWKNSLPGLLTVPGCTVILTSYTESEAKSDFKRLHEVSKSTFKVLVECEENPFRSLYPYRDWDTASKGIFYINHFLYVLKT